MKRFVEGQDRGQLILLSECLDDYVGEENPVRVVDAFIDEVDLAILGFAGVIPEATGRPSYHPVTLLKIYLYGYLNRVQSSRRLERKTQRNIELMWLIGRLMPDFKTIVDFRPSQLPSSFDGVQVIRSRPLEAYSRCGRTSRRHVSGPRCIGHRNGSDSARPIARIPPTSKFGHIEASGNFG